MSVWITVLTSAAIGALVSSVTTVYGQYLERRSRRNELLLVKALEMAVQQRDHVMKVVAESRGEAILFDPAINAETYFRWLKGLLDHGKLPADADKWRPPKSATK